MNKRLFIGGLLVSAAISLQAQDIIFECDFENGLPETFATYDRDGNTPSRSMTRYGFAEGIAWLTAAEEGAEPTNTAAYSGSWYKTAATSDDWLVTPAITVTDVRTILSWRARAFDSEHPDGYAVYVSTTGNTPDDFTETALLTVSGEKATWTEYFLPLEAYAGKTIHVAFVNNSTNCNLLLLDDLRVFTREHSFSLTNLTPEAVSEPGEVAVQAVVTSSGFLPVEGYKVELTYEGQTYVIDHTDRIVQPDERDTVTFDTRIVAELDATKDYTLTISSMEGADVQTVEGSVTCFRRTVLIEESTGTWCMWCPRGQYGLQLLHEKHPGEFIDIAVHMSDPMMVKDYILGIYDFFHGTAPYCVMDRKAHLTGDPYNDSEKLLAQARAEGAIGKVEWECAYWDTPMGALFLRTKTEFGKTVEAGRYRLAFVLVEDKVTGYEQSNGYSGGSTVMGGFELLPDPIPAGEYEFANVGRAIYPSVHGDSLAFPAGTPRHTAIENNYAFELPAALSYTNTMKMVALLIDGKTNEVINAAEKSLTFVTGIETTSADNNTVRFLPASRTLTVTAATPLRTVDVWSLGGQLLHRATPGCDRYTLPQVCEEGTVIVKACTDAHSGVTKWNIR